MYTRGTRRERANVRSSSSSQSQRFTPLYDDRGAMSGCGVPLLRIQRNAELVHTRGFSQVNMPTPNQIEFCSTCMFKCHVSVDVVSYACLGFLIGSHTCTHVEWIYSLNGKTQIVGLFILYLY